MPSESQPTNKKITGILLCRDRVAIYLGGRGSDAVKALHGAGSVFEKGELKALLEDALCEGLIGQKVAIGVDPLLEFFSTQRRVSFQEGGKAESLLEELRGKYEGRLVVEPMRTALSPKTHQTAIAVPAQELQESAEAFAAMGGGKVKFVSTTHAFYAMAADESRTPKGWGSEIRVFFGSHEGLVLFAVDGTLIARQIFEYSGQAKGAVLSAVSGMIAAVKEGLALPEPSGILFHVGQDDTTFAELCEEATGVPARSCSHLIYDQATLAAALAFDGFRKKRQELDFLHQAEQSISAERNNIVPIKSVATLAASILGMGAYLWSAGSAVQSQIDQATARASEALDLYDQDPFQLEEAEDQLTKTVSVGEAFLMDRVYWSDYLREIPKLLPDNMTLVRIAGADTFLVPDEDADDEEGNGGGSPSGRGESDRFLEIGMNLPLESEKSSTPEIVSFTDALKTSKVFQKSFRTIPAATVSRLEDNGRWHAEITMRCMP